jgi:hypothetical protein
LAGSRVNITAALVQTFQAGRMGLFFWTTGALRSILNGVGDKFELRTA